MAPQAEDAIMSTASQHRAHHHRHEPRHFVDEVARVCEARELKLTPLRRRVLELIARERKPVKAYDLLGRLKEEREHAAPPTVYRALDFLLEHGFIHKLESVNSYTSCHHPAERHTVPFFICDECETATELCDQKVALLLDKQAATLGFTPATRTVEVHGLCARCK
jgi:Fur family zinc uptake transcriptional regulator